MKFCIYLHNWSLSLEKSIKFENEFKFSNNHGTQDHSWPWDYLQEHAPVALIQWIPFFGTVIHVVVQTLHCFYIGVFGWSVPFVHVHVPTYCFLYLILFVVQLTKVNRVC